MKVSFDYDGTLTKSTIKDRAKSLIEKGDTVYIISARRRKLPMMAVATALGIPESRVFATGSNKNKIEKIKELNIDKHYDNNPNLKKLLPEVIDLV